MKSLSHDLNSYRYQIHTGGFKYTTFEVRVTLSEPSVPETFNKSSIPGPGVPTQLRYYFPELTLSTEENLGKTEETVHSCVVRKGDLLRRYYSTVEPSLIIGRGQLVGRPRNQNLKDGKSCHSCI